MSLGPWDLEEAVEFVRMLSAYVEPVGYYLGMTGSVLYRGRSLKDLDLIVYPASSKVQNQDELVTALLKAGLERRADRAKVHRAWRILGSEDEKHVEVWEYAGKRVDFFLLS